MKLSLPKIGILAVTLILSSYAQSEPFQFTTVSIDENFPRGYQLKIADVNADGAPDIIALREGTDGLVAWYENPSWTPRRITPESITRPLTIAPKDIDGDGDLDMALGYEFDFGDSVEKGAVCWLEQGDDATALWKPYPIDREPMMHRVAWVDLDGDGKEELVGAPLMGKGTKPPEYLQAPVRIKRSIVPDDPKSMPWPTEVFYDKLHVIHGLTPLYDDAKKTFSLLIASYEGISQLHYAKSGTVCTLWHQGHQLNELSKGSSEVEPGQAGNTVFYASIEPRHGNEVALYFPQNGNPLQMERIVIDNTIRVGHGLLCADLNDDGISEVLVGDRGDTKSYYLYYAADKQYRSWKRMPLDDGGMAGAGCASEDMDGDGDLDVVAVGSSTGNVRLYVNQRIP